MKTVEELLGYLEPEHREKALRNGRNYGCLKRQVPSISEAINSFTWHDSPEGSHYWDELYTKYNDLETKELKDEKS